MKHIETQFSNELCDDIQHRLLDFPGLKAYNLALLACNVGD